MRPSLAESTITLATLVQEPAAEPAAYATGPTGRQLTQRASQFEKPAVELVKCIYDIATDEGEVTSSQAKMLWQTLKRSVRQFMQEASDAWTSFFVNGSAAAGPKETPLINHPYSKPEPVSIAESLFLHVFIQSIHSWARQQLVSGTNLQDRAASTRLQHRLLATAPDKKSKDIVLANKIDSMTTIETNETVQRAEVEREMAIREHQVLQESPRRNAQMSPCSPQASAQRHLELALKECRQLQFDNEQLERRMYAAWKLKRDLSGKREDLLGFPYIRRLRVALPKPRSQLLL
ncbi:MAG: hypothetical protein Q9173_007118 [Seirophora scorigena]